MKKHVIQQEVLLVTSTTFSDKQLCSMNEQEPNKLSKEDQLEAACWNGLLDDLLPEVMKKQCCGQKLYLWNVHQGTGCLQIQLGEFSLAVETAFSINTLFFLPALHFN